MYEIVQISSGDLHHFFGYYGINPWDESGKYHLALATNFDDRRPEYKDKAGVGVIEKNTGKFIKYGETSAFNLQQGSMLHWIKAKAGEEFTYNFFDKKKELKARAVNRKTGVERIISAPVAAVSPDRSKAVGLNFKRMFFCRQVVGYDSGEKDISLKNFPPDDGLFHIDLKTGKSSLLLSLKEVKKDGSAGKLPSAQPSWFNLVSYSPEGSRILFLFRVKTKKGWLSSLWTVNKDGSGLECQIPAGNWISHYYWKNESKILVTTDILGKPAYVEFTPGKKDFHQIGEGILTEDGHCSFSPDKKWILSDTYPHGENNQAQLFLYNIEEKKKIILGQFHHDQKYQGIIRCDLHPRFSKDGSIITFDSVHGEKRQIYGVYC